MVNLGLEDHLGEICPRSHKPHEAHFTSIFLKDWHYVAGTCSHCGYHIEFRKDELGGGLFLPDGGVVRENFHSSRFEHAWEKLAQGEAGRQDHGQLRRTADAVR